VKFSLDWLNDFVDVAAAGGPDVIRERLSAAGIAIEGVEAAGADKVLEAEITPNRPDAMNHRGLAREIAATCGIALRSLPGGAGPGESGESADALARVTIDVPDRCHRFAVRVVRGTSVKPSPAKIQTRLHAIGLAPINALVDATNVSLWELGQPLHAFDADRVVDRHLIVRLASRGERLLCLDGVERELHPEDVVVADRKRVLSLAGVIGGSESAISEATKNVLLEAAWWDPASVHRTARRHGLHTDASHRFERGADVQAIPAGLAVASKLILASCGGTLAPRTVDNVAQAFEPRRLTLRLSKLRALSGLSQISLERAAEILISLGFGVGMGKDALALTAPSWRLDVQIEEDAIEEVCRIHGYGSIPSVLPPIPGGSQRFVDGSDGVFAPRELEDRVADAARAAGLSQAVNFPFVSSREGEDVFGNLLAKERFLEAPLHLENPLDRSRSTLRRLLLPGLLGAVSRNFRNGQRSISLFEVGRVWDTQGATADGPGDTPGYESRHFAFALAGAASSFWDRPARDADFFDGRAVLERLIADFPEAGGWRFVAARAAGLSPGAAASFQDERGRLCGVVGRLDESVRQRHELPVSVVCGELALETLPAARMTPRFQPYSALPPIDVDVTLTHPDSLTWAALAQELQALKLPDLESFGYADRYTGPGVAEGWAKSTIALRFRSRERTLSQEDVNRQRDRFLEAAIKKFGVRT
jgi:phenylalanyl-tRNA synthetase beta chain